MNPFSNFDDIPNKFSKLEIPIEYNEEDFSSFENLPREILKGIYDHVLNREEFPTKEQRKCATKNYASNKYITNFLTQDFMYNDLPSVLEYQQSNLYLLESLNYDPPYIITCKDICINCKENLPKDISYYEVENNIYSIRIPDLFPKDTFYEYMSRADTSLVTNIITPLNLQQFHNRNTFNDILETYNNLNTIIWNCSCIVVQLSLGFINNYMLFEQRILKTNSQSWQVIDLINEVINFYQDFITQREAIQLIPLLKEEQENLEYDLIEYIQDRGFDKETWFTYKYGIPREDLPIFLTEDYLIKLPRHIFAVYNKTKPEIFNNLDIFVIQNKKNESVYLFNLS